MEFKIALIVRNKQKSKPYVDALCSVKSVESVKLVPVPIRVPSPFPVHADDFDGVVLMGGKDINPARYGQARGQFTEPPDDQRDDFEIGFSIQALESRLPMLAICRGMQLINVACGGSLIQHLPRAQAGQADQKRKALILPDTILKSVIHNEEVEINPRHHQGIGDLGKGVVPVSIAEDHVIEAFELKGHPAFLGIGWHPEDRVFENTPGGRADRSLFEWFARRVGGETTSMAAD